MEYFFKLLILWILSALVVPNNATASNRIALVLGNSDYQLAPLINPVNDARDMAAVLKECGFTVTLKLNTSRKEMEMSLREFGRALSSSKVGLFYYAGHGMQLKGRNYLIPVNALIESESDIEFESLDAGRILGKMEDAGNSLNIVILDACRNNPFSRSFRSSTSRGLIRMDAPKGSLIAYATAPGSVAEDGEDRNGTYTKYLIENIKKTGLSLEEVFKNARVAVLEETEDRQVPWETSSLTGNFYFKKRTLDMSEPDKLMEVIKVERKKIQLEKKELENLKTEVERGLKSKDDERFKKDGANIILDKQTRFEWIVGIDQNTNYNDAKKWITILNGREANKWRLPTVFELRSLYQEGRSDTNLPLNFQTSGWFVWAGEKNFFSSYANGFNFSDGRERRYKASTSRGRRAFAIRVIN